MITSRKHLGSIRSGLCKAVLFFAVLLLVNGIGVSAESVGTPAKNVILFIGDGMGISTITAARIFDGQHKGGKGVDNSLSFEKFPYTAFSRTYSANYITTDSAPGMSAIMTGHKCQQDTLSVDETVELCQPDIKGHEAKTFLEICKEKGKAVGVVSTTRATHATPGACYAHVSARDWECDADSQKIPGQKVSYPLPAGQKDIAAQLLDFPGGIDVALAGGRKKFMKNDQVDPIEPKTKGSRKDGRDLVAEWQAKGGKYVYDKKGLESVTSGRLLGLFHPDMMSYNAFAKREIEPSLTEMTTKTIELLSQNPKGFFMMVEGGRIDSAHHACQALKACDETVELSKAVEAAVGRVNLNETLIIVTADHSHSLTFVGYGGMPTKIGGSALDEHGKPQKDRLGNPFDFLVYGGSSLLRGSNASSVKTTAKEPFDYDAMTMTTNVIGKVFEGAVLTGGSTHGAEDVPVYATGANANLVHGAIENTHIFEIMMEAAGFKKD
ncbi:MAG: alkaline phosphatase [Kiritimatiellae bacterium]|nr:alkaline phosphatase [Kiritimatiellia bacterium]MDD5522992.1 alkaline phosphatase [Kiritimatiellia bacterium]